ncbi:MAG: sulfite exporter TauE/SafE family protein [Candidatus Krumholzibacteriia bacterium]
MTVDFDLINALILLGAGLGAGLVAGFAGVGGGIVMVPVLLELMRAWGVPQTVVVQAAMATSLAVGSLNAASAAWRQHHQRRIVWRLVVPVVPSSMLGAWLGSAIASQLDGRVLQFGLAGVLLFAAWRLTRQAEPVARGDGVPTRSLLIWAAVGLGVGLFSGLSGLAGGVVLIPALALVGKLPSRFLAATSAAVVMFTAATGAAGYMRYGPATERLGDGFVGYVCLPAAACLAVSAIPMAQVGARLNKRTSGVWFRRVFAAMMVLVVTRLALTA